MNRGITIAWKGTGKSALPEVLVTPEVPFNEQRRNFRKLRAQLTGFDELELWSSGQGRVKRYRFKSKVVAPATPVVEKDTTVEPAAEALSSPDSAPASPSVEPAAGNKPTKGSTKKTSKKKK